MKHILPESEKVEFKVQATDELYREVIAFANTDGGTIYIGIDDNGDIIGLDNIDESYTRITNGIRDAIQPDITMAIKYTLEDNKIIKIQVGEGNYKPYYLKSKGLKPSGVFVRQGASTAQASFDNIRQMIRDTDGNVFETMRSIEQDLTFDEAQKAFQLYQVPFLEEKYVSLGLINKQDNLYTNLALLLSDQCKHTTKIAVFDDLSKTIFKDSQEYGGSIFNQLSQSFAYLKLQNNTHAEIHDLQRIEQKDYPNEAIREALLNALIHRDYSISGSIIINVTTKETEFISIGGLMPGFTTEDIQSGISLPRNKNLAEIFHRLKLIEAYGTGIRRIYKLYSNCTVQPQIIVTPNTFKMILPNKNAVDLQKNLDILHTDNLTKQQQQVLTYLEKNKEATEEELQSLLHIKKTRLYTILRPLRDSQIVNITGRGKNKVYHITIK